MKAFKQDAHDMDLMTGPLWNKILAFALPLAATGVLQQLFNAADLAVVGRFTGAQSGVAMAAVGANAPIIGLVINTFIGISLGTNVVIANAVGREDEDAIQKAAHTSVLLAVVMGLFIAVCAQLFAVRILSAQNIPEDVLDLAVQYFRIYMAGAPVILLYNFESAVFRGIGNTKILGGGMWPTYGQRWTAANKGQDLVKLGFYMPLLTAIGVTLPGGLVGMMGNLMDIDYPTLNDVFTMATAKVVPFWGVIVTVGVLAAGMSTVAGTLSCASMIISKDVVSHVKKDATDKQVVHAGRISVVIITILAFLCSLRIPSSITMLIQISGSFFILALIPYSGLFLFRRVTTPGVIAGMLGGLAALTFFTFRQPNFLGVATGLWSFGTGVVLCIVASLFTSPIPQEERSSFLKPLRDHRSYSVTRVD